MAFTKVRRFRKKESHLNKGSHARQEGKGTSKAKEARL